MNDLFGNRYERRWYVIQTYSGYEKKVLDGINERTRSMHMEDKIFDVIIPISEKVIEKEGKKVVKKTKLFPSYVLVEMMLDEQSWYAVRHTPGVTGFVGSGNHPIPLTKKEADELLGKIRPQQEKVKVDIKLSIGDIVRPKNGQFAQAGPVVAIDPEKGKIKYVIEIFNRKTEAEIDYADIEKVE